MFESTTVPLLQEVVNFAQARHGVLAGNVANMDTPGYRTRDLSIDRFQERLKEALETTKQGHETWSSSGVLTQDPEDPLREVGESLNSILYHDETNVSMEQQILQISKNQQLHNMAISLLKKQFDLLQAAISERV